jgi:hypothetical protein
MRYTDIISRIVPFLATVTLGLLITSLFVPISAPRFGFGVRNGHHNGGMKYHKMRHENERLRYENEQLRRVNSELIERLDDTLFENGLPEPPPVYSKPKLPVKTNGSGYNYSAPVR